MDPKCNDWCPYNTQERAIWTDSEETHREVGHVVMRQRPREAAIAEAGRGKERCPRGCRGAQPWR